MKIDSHNRNRFRMKIDVENVAVLDEEGKAMTKVVETKGRKYTLLRMNDGDDTEDYYAVFSYDAEGVFEEDYLLDVECVEDNSNLGDYVLACLRREVQEEKRSAK